MLIPPTKHYNYTVLLSNTGNFVDVLQYEFCYCIYLLS